VKRPYYLKKRGAFWYYRLNPESGLITGENLNYYTTGCRTREAAEAFMADMLGEERETPTFRCYAQPFFIWGECPHIRRVLEETGRFTQRHARIQRGRLENYIFSDPFAYKRLSEITRADIFDLRSRLLRRCSPATTNKVIDVVKVVLREAVIREELDRDPSELVRRVHHKKRERGIFTVEELKRLFPDYGYGPWKDARDYTCFFLAAVSGARRGELLVLRWRHINFPDQYLNITEAWKGRDEIGDTKSGRSRIVPLSSRIIEKFDDLRLESLHLQPDDFLFCYDDGSRVGETWWCGRFKRALQRAHIEPGDRWLTPHSFRHTINTIVRDSGHDQAKIRAVLGWMDEEIQDNYTHWEAQHLRRWAEIVDDIWG
jgi:integrase